MTRLSAILIVPAVAACLLVTGCGETTVTRTSTTEVRDLTGNWNDTDSRTTAEALIADSLRRPWADNFRTANGRAPVVKFGRIVVRVGEVISTDIFINDLAREFVNSGKVEVVASSDEAAAAREERADQAVHASADTAAPNFQETGCDFIVVGEINADIDQAGGESRKVYSVDIKVYDVKTQKMVYAGNHKIPKNISRSGYR